MFLKVVWCAGVLCKGMAAYRTARSGMIRFAPSLWLYIAVFFIYSAGLLAVRPNYTAYLQVYSIGLPVILVLQLVATTAIFRLVTVNYPNFRIAGSVLFGALAIAGVGAAWATSYFSAAANGQLIASLWEAMMFAQRYTFVVIVVVLLGVLVFLPRWPCIPIPRSARAAAWIMVFDAGSSFAGVWFTEYYGYEHPVIMATLSAARGLVLALAWMRLKPAWEFVSVPLATAAERAESRAAARRFRQIFD